MSHTLRLIRGDKRSPTEVIDLAEGTSTSNVFLRVGGFAPRAGVEQVQWSGRTARRDGQVPLASSRDNAELSITYDLHGGGAVELQNVQNRVGRFLHQAFAYETERIGDPIWLEYRWADGLNDLPAPVFGQMSYYFRVLWGEVPGWPKQLHSGTLTAGNIESVVCNLICEPTAEGLEQVAGTGGGGLLVSDLGLTVAEATTNYIKDPQFSNDTLSTYWTANSVTITPAYGTAIIDGATLNGNMETGDPPTGWSSVGSSTPTSVADERTGGAGSKSLNVVRGTTGAVATQTATGVAETWYMLDGWVKNIDATGITLYFLGMQTTRSTTTSTDWTYQAAVGRTVASTNVVVRPWLDGSAGVQGRFDDIRVRPLTTSSIFTGTLLPYQDVDMSVDITLAYDTTAGIFIAGDAANPTSGVLFRINGDTVCRYYLASMAASVYTAIDNSTVTYSAGAPLRMTKSGNVFTMYYNGSQVGTPQTIAGMTGYYVGLFNTYSGNTLSDITVKPYGT